MTVLVLADHDNQSLKPATLSAVTAARQCGDEVHILVAGSRCDAVAAAAANVRGVTRVLMADGPQFADGLPENVAQQVHALGLTGTYSHIVAAATSYGKSILPRAAARLNVGQISEVTKVLSADTFERPIYAGNAIATVQALGAIKVLTIRATNFEAAAIGGAAQIHQVATAADSGRSVFVSRMQVVNARPELTAAPIVVAGGRGLGSGEQFKILEPLADRLGAALGASRAAVDAGFAPNDLQIGQTGKVVAPGLYIAVGISGAIQHLAGMTDSKIIVAINKDPEAPIFSVADYGIVGDLFEVVPQLMAALSLEPVRAD